MSVQPETIQGAPDTPDEYDEMVEQLDEIIELGLSKLTGDGRIRDNEKAKARCEYMKRVEQAVKAKRQVVKDKRLMEMGRKLEKLEESGEIDL
ncbi:hypothetical protein D8Y22_06585 [Salinadaptatus halalkaliphilus]|uniref:DUF8136 domain-containing protein n=1 Tax=Salinadaptatus halalkaliphilus TaxID=2419781 RepID=A0A4S3TN41_9EURY|nr:hypothetical protein [Salinadaptatus halalkaliphilus]THE65596.1 hypothetical protein D8Y22_06585 [Salinadaptatus halalkaliphilus]